MSSTTRHADGSTDSKDDDVPELTDDEMYFLLSSERRREAIRAVCEADGPLKRAELTEKVTAAEYGDDFTADDRSRIHISLYQAHLDKLDDAGVVDFDDPYVAPGPHAGRVYSHVAEKGVRGKLAKFLVRT